MNENTKRENSLEERREQSRKKIDQQITKLEGIIEALMAGVNMDDLTSKERLRYAACFTALHQRAVLLNRALEKTQAESAESTALALMMRGMKEEIEKEQRLRVIDAGVTVYQEIDDHRLDIEISESDE